MVYSDSNSDYCLNTLDLQLVFDCSHTMATCEQHITIILHMAGCERLRVLKRQLIVFTRVSAQRIRFLREIGRSSSSFVAAIRNCVDRLTIDLIAAFAVVDAAADSGVGFAWMN